MGFNACRTLDDGRVVGGYARIWGVEDKGNYSTAELSTSKKKEDGSYETDFQNKFVRLVGTAHQIARGLTTPCNIQIKNCDVTRWWSKEKEKEYINFVIFDFDVMDTGQPAKSTQAKSTAEIAAIPDDVDGDEMPW